MTNNQLTDAQISNATLIRLIQWADEHKSHYVASALRELQERRKADREPVAEVVSIYGDPEAFGEREIRPLVGIQQMPYGTKLYRHAQPDASHLSRICAESYQVVGALAEALRVFNDVGVIKALDNLSAQELIHDDVLPFSAPESAQPAPVAFDAIDTNLIESLRLVQCMLDDYRERNYGDAQGWIRHINTHMSDYTEAHGDDAYSVLHNLITAAPQSPGSEPATVPGKWIPVSERIPEEGGRYWCYVEEQNSLGKSHYQWNCSWDGDVWSDKALTGRVTHWMPLPAAPQEFKP
jgi:hypothetical protein|nr:MAG TPA: Protein of unknown function (DUF551) [Caudoviricetes sp.]